MKFAFTFALVCFFLVPETFGGYPSFSASEVCQHYISIIPYITIRKAGEDQGLYRFFDLDFGLNRIEADWDMQLGVFVRNHIRRPENPDVPKSTGILIGFLSGYIRQWMLSDGVDDYDCVKLIIYLMENGYLSYPSRALSSEPSFSSEEYGSSLELPIQSGISSYTQFSFESSQESSTA